MIDKKFKELVTKIHQLPGNPSYIDIANLFRKALIEAREDGYEFAQEEFKDANTGLVKRLSEEEVKLVLAKLPMTAKMTVEERMAYQRLAAKAICSTFGKPKGEKDGQKHRI